MSLPISKNKHVKKIACSYNDDQECLYQTKGLAPSENASRKSEELDNIQANQLIRKATTTLKNLSEGKPQQTQGLKTTDYAFCEMIVMLLNTMKDDSAKEFLILQNNTVTSPLTITNRKNIKNLLYINMCKFDSMKNVML